MSWPKFMDGNCTTPWRTSATPFVASGPGNIEINVIKATIFILRAVGFMSFMIFILCLPLGDPEETCVTAEVCKQGHVTSALVYNYVCTVYKVFSTTLNFTSSTLKDASEYTGCAILQTLHGIKLKFYNFLTAVDQEELCRTVCCQEDSELEVEPTRHPRRNCKCKAKCCKRQ